MADALEKIHGEGTLPAMLVTGCVAGVFELQGEKYRNLEVTIDDIYMTTPVEI